MLVDGARRIAVLRANAIGDFLMIVPALEALHQAYPEAEITVIGDAWLPDLLQGRPGPWTGGVVVAPRYPGLRGASTAVAPDPAQHTFFEEHAGRYDVAIQMHGGGATSNGFVRRLMPRVSAGARSPDAEPLDRWVPYIERRHEVLRWLEVAELVGATGPAGTSHLAPRLTVIERDLADSRAAWPSDEPFAVLHVGARDHRRRWAPRFFADVARHLRRQHGLRCVLVGGTGDRTAAQQTTAHAAEPVADLTGRLSLGGTLGLLSRSSLFVGNDSGPRHLAVAAGVPTVGIFWIGNMLTFGPLTGANHRATISFRMHCPRCGQQQLEQPCSHDISLVDEVRPHQVVGTIDELLAGRRTARAVVGTG
jgi:ADP-heptose:LPS heptosyltransferase